MERNENFLFVSALKVASLALSLFERERLLKEAAKMMSHKQVTAQSRFTC